MRAVRYRASGFQPVSIPDLFSVPGNPVAGFLLAGKGAGGLPALVLAALAAVCADAAGRLVQEAARPSARLGPAGTLLVVGRWLGAAVLLAAGAGLCRLIGGHTYWIGLSLILATLLHALGLGDVRYAGALAAGLCRGLALLLGAAAAAGPEWYRPEVMLGFDMTVLYAAAVAHLVQEEAPGRKLGAGRWAPAFVVCAAFAAFSRLQAATSASEWVVFAGSFALAALLALAVGDILDTAAAEGEAQRSVLFHERQPGRVPLLSRLVHLLYSSQLLVQAGLSASSGRGEAAVLAGLALVGLWPLSRMLSRWE